MFRLIFLLLLGAVSVSLLPINGSSRIVGGSTAVLGQFKYQVSLRKNLVHFCGGSIISNAWVLTAAHCIYAQTAQSFILIVGTIELQNSGDAYGVSRIVNHPQYTPQSSYNDIALLAINGQIAFTSTVGSITLASSSTPGQLYLTLSGWGYTSYPSTQLATRLQYIRLLTITLEQCRSLLSGYPIGSGNLCTYNVAGQGACEGDSGSPLVYGAVQHGIASWGIPCALGRPDVFTDIFAYRAWIRSTTGV